MQDHCDELSVTEVGFINKVKTVAANTAIIQPTIANFFILVAPSGCVKSMTYKM